MATTKWIAVIACCMLTGACASTIDESSSVTRVVAALQSRPVALLGEVHDNVEQHRIRAEALRIVLADGARPALLMEQFDRERQGDLDRALAKPDATPDSVIAAATSGSTAMQGWSWPLYRPYLALAIAYHLTIVAANVSRADTRAIVQDGLRAGGFDDAVPDDILRVQTAAIVAGHCGMVDAAQASRLARAQFARDQFMARAIEAHSANGAVLLAGNGHVRRDIGVPRWLNPATRARSLSIGLLEADDPNVAAFDVVIVTAAQSRPDPCEGIRMPSAASRP
ncbi:MAG: ChaN family lipoprotein [Burkholderiaceae bacterium]